MATNNATNNLKGTTITGTSNQITVTNGDGVAGVPTISLPTTIGNLSNTTRTVFIATLSGAVSNVTGDGTVYTIAFDTVTQQGSAFNTGTNTFTAPATGYYLFNANAALSSVGASHTQAVIDIFINGATTKVLTTYNPTNAYNSTLGYVTFTGSKIVSLAASDTVIVRATVAGSTKTVGLSNTNEATVFSGIFLC